MRGISAVIQLILILFIIITLAALFWLFTSGTIKSLTSSGTERTEKTREILSTCMIVDSVSKNKIYIKNCGHGIIANDSLNIYIDDEPLRFNMTPETVKKGEVGTITIPKEKLYYFEITPGDHDLKVSNPSLQIVQKIESVALFQDISDYLILDLEFDEGQGTTAYDSSIYGNDGTLYNNPVWVDGIIGKALQFDGNNDYVRISSISQLGSNPPSTRPGATNGPVTITLWFKTFVVPPTETKYLFTDNWYELGFALVTSGDLRSEVYVFVDSLETITTDEWHFAALSYDFDNHKMYFYLDNEFQGSASIGTGNVNGFNDEPFFVGADYQGGNYEGHFNGIIDQVKVYKRTFTQDEMSKINKIDLKIK
jgi:hypothetical protein